MKSVTAKLIEQIMERPDALFVARREENYDLFLDLYQQVGYAPDASADLEAWKARSRDIWKLQDSILPGCYTGGLSNGKVVSAFGALPMTENALWGHSGCMIKTLDAAVTFFAQALHIVDRIDTSPRTNCYIGSYAHRSRLTSLFQRPLSGPIPDQLEIEVVGLPCDFELSNETGLKLLPEPFTRDHLNSLSVRDCGFLKELCTRDPLFSQIRNTVLLVLKDAESGVTECLALTQSTPPEATAANIFSWTWIFPAIHTQVTSRFIQSLRSVPEIGTSYLQVVLRQQNDFELHDLRVPLDPAFWAVTPQWQLNALRESYRDAFLPVLDRYPQDELRELSERLAKR